MSCFAKIKSPLSGNDVTSVAYYQTTTFFPPEVGRKIYEATTTTAFKVDLGFDWTKLQTGYSHKLNKDGEPTMEEMNSILNLRLTQRQLDAAAEIEEFANQGYLNVGFDNPQAFELIEGEVNLNPKYENVESEITVRDGKYYINVKPRTTGDKVQKPVNKQFLKRVGFSPLLINSVKEFSNANLSELMDSLIQSTEIEEFQREMLKKLRTLMKVNPTLKLTVFDDTVVDENFQRSFYDPSTNTVYIGKTLSSKFGDKELVRDLIHEAVHAYTISAINNPRTTQELQFKNEMVKLYEGYKNTFKIVQNWYGLQNVEEFVAEFVSNPYFRENLKDAEEGTTRNQNFFLRAITSIRNFFSSIFSGVVDRNTTMFAQVEKALDDYLNYLETLGDMPDHFAEHHIRFNSTYQGRQARNIGQRSPLFNDFYTFVENSLTSSSWKQLAQSMNELDSRLNNIEKLKQRFGNLSIPSTKGTLNDAIGYLESMVRLLDSLQSDVNSFDNDSKEYTGEELVRIFNNAKSVSELFAEQIQGFNFLMDAIDVYMTSDTYNQPGQAEEFAKRLEAINTQVPDVNNLKGLLKQVLVNVNQKIQTLNTSSKKSLVKAAAVQIVPIFKDFIEKQNSPDSQLNKELEAINNELEILRRQLASPTYKQPKGEAILSGKFISTKLQDLEARKEQLEKFKSFIPTADNIQTLFENATASGMKDANFLTRYLSVGNMTGRPILDIMKQFIDVHIIEAENESIKTRARIQSLHERISNFNKKRNLLNRYGSFGSFYEGFTRKVEMHYYDKDGKKTVMEQLAFQTRFKEAEFQNDLKAHQAKLKQALKTGDEILIKEAEDAFNKFVEDYAVRPYTDEYYEAEALLTEDARNARQEIYDEIEALEDVLGDEDFFDDGNITTQARRKQLLRELESLGSIYNLDGSEKPIGSKEREIAVSIIQYKKARKELEINEYVIPDNVLKKFKSKKSELERKVNEANAALNLAKQQLNEAELNQVGNVVERRKAVIKAEQNLKTVTEEQKKWLDNNTRTEIDPKFFEKQRMIAEQIKEILAKYGQEARIPELYEEIFSTARGFRDRDGIVVGSEMSEGLVKKINQLETELEALKKKAKDSRQISAEDKEALKTLFRKLNEIQTKENTDYYYDTVATIKDQLRTNLLADRERTRSIEEEAKRRVDEYFNTGNTQQFDDIDIDTDEFVDRTLTTPVDRMHRNALVAEITDKLIESELNKDFFNSDWYNNNHVVVEKTIVDKSTGESITTVESRPIYIWVKTIPKDSRYIKQQSPSFTWYKSRIRDAYKVKDAKFMGEFRPRMTADKKYVNEEYEKIEREQPELKELIDEMVSIYESQQKLLPVSQRNEGYTVINQGKSGAERKYNLITRPLFSFKTGWDSFKVVFKRNIPGTSGESQEVEEDIETANKQLKGRLVRLVKTRYKTPLSTSEVSGDLLGALSSFSLYTSEFKGLQKAMPVVFGLRDVAAENATGREMEVQMLDDTIQRFFYGEELGFRGGVSSIVPEIARPMYRNLIRFLSKTFRFTQARVLIFNLLRWPKNIITNVLRGMLNAKKYGVRRRDVLKGFFKGYWNFSTLLSLHAGNRKMNKEAMLMTHFRAIPSADPTKQAGKIHQHGIFKYLNAEFLTDATSGYLEGASTRGIYEAMMNKSPIPIIKDGVTQYVKVRDAYELIDNVLVPKDGVFGIEMDAMRQLIIQRKANLEEFLANNGVRTREQLSGKLRIQYDNLLKAEDQKIAALEQKNKPKIQQLKNFEQSIRDNIHQMYTSTQGNYFKRSRSQYETNLFLSIMLSMKRWLVPSFQNAYGSRRFNVSTGNIDQGYMNYTFSEFLWRKIKYLTHGQRMSVGSTTHQRERLQRTMLDNVVTFSLMGISSIFGTLALSALKGLGMGDDEDSDIYWLFFTALVAAGTYDEYTSTHPIALYNFVEKTFNKKPLEKYGADESMAVSAVKHVFVSIFGQQWRSIEDLADAIGMLAGKDGNIFKTYEEQYSDMRQIQHRSPFQGMPIWKAAALKAIGFEIGAKPLSSTEMLAKRYITQMRYTPLLGVPDVEGQLVVINNEIDEILKRVQKRDIDLMKELAAIEESQMVLTKKGLQVNEDAARKFVDEFLKTEQGKVIVDDLTEVYVLKEARTQITENNPILKKKENEKYISQLLGRKDSETVEKFMEMVAGGTPKVGKTKEYEVIKARENLYQQISAERIQAEARKNADKIIKSAKSLKVNESGEYEFEMEGQFEPFR